MIRPKPKPAAGRVRGVATLLTALLLVGAQAGLKGLAIPAFASGRSVIRELDPLMFERFAVPPAPEGRGDADEEPVAEAPEAEEPTATFEQEVGAAMEQLDQLFAADDPAAPAVGREEGNRPGVDAGGISADVPADRFESLFGAGGADVAGRPGARRPSAARAGGAGIGLGIEERPAARDSTAADPAAGLTGPGVSVRTGADRSGLEEGGELAIRVHEAEAFDGSEADRLAVWMRAHPAELPVGVRVHMNYEAAFLTSASAFSSGGREWELYLMFNESLQEVHVVLIEGTRSVYLIDRGFQEQSRSLREGTVRRSGGQIMAIDSRTGAASGDQAREFYNVFLSWWEAARAEVGGG
jgi:hypothetical protein